jgi:hypothetical protein
MPPKSNPLRLNPLQCRTLALLQAVARDPNAAKKDERSGYVHITRLPHAHGDHFHVGEFMVRAKDATGLSNEAVWAALDRKGLVRAEFPHNIHITSTGMEYDSGVAHQVLHRSTHEA